MRHKGLLRGISKGEPRKKLGRLENFLQIMKDMDVGVSEKGKS